MILPKLPRVLDSKVIVEICADVNLYACFMMKHRKYDPEIDAIHNSEVCETFKEQERKLLEEAKQVLAKARQTFNWTVP